MREIVQQNLVQLEIERFRNPERIPDFDYIERKNNLLRSLPQPKWFVNGTLTGLGIPSIPVVPISHSSQYASVKPTRDFVAGDFTGANGVTFGAHPPCLLYTSDAADE